MRGAGREAVRNRLLTRLLRTAVAWACLRAVVPVDPVCGGSLEHTVQRGPLTLPLQPPALCLL